MVCGSKGRLQEENQSLFFFLFIEKSSGTKVKGWVWNYIRRNCVLLQQLWRLRCAIISGSRYLLSEKNMKSWMPEVPSYFYIVRPGWPNGGVVLTFRGSGCYTAVHTVLTVNSVSLAMMSVGWMLRSYIGFSNVARPLVFSWPT